MVIPAIKLEHDIKLGRTEMTTSDGYVKLVWKKKQKTAEIS